MEVGKRVWACSHSSAYFHHANNYCCYYTTYSQPFIMPLHWQCKKNMLYWRGDKCVSKKLMPTKSGILESASGTNFLIWTKVFIYLEMTNSCLCLSVRKIWSPISQSIFNGISFFYIKQRTSTCSTLQWPYLFEFFSRIWENRNIP